MTRLFVVVAFLFSFHWIAAQKDTLSSRKIARKSRPAYLMLGAGVNSASFRDFATSPLSYQGLSGSFLLGRTKYSAQRASNFYMLLAYGGYHAKVNKSRVGGSNIGTLFFNYTQLYVLKRFSAKKWNVKVGGTFNATGNVRYNAGLLNNSVGGEIFANLFASGKITRDISRNKEKQKKLLFWHYTLRPRERSLSLQVNVPLTNSTFRNGYVYAGQSALLNRPALFDGYVFKVFSGYRLRNEMAYTIFLTNRNALQFSYVWDVYKTGGALDQFEMANHLMTFTLLFKIK